MLPPVTGPAVPIKASPTPVETTQAAQSAQRSPFASKAEAGPAKIAPETLRAIDPASQSQKSDRVLSDRSNQTDTRPAGPPPAFVETLLERQARVALDPPETTPPPQEDTATPPTEVQVEAGFAEARALASEPQTPEVDLKE